MSFEAWRLHISTFGASRSQICVIRGLAASLFTVGAPRSHAFIIRGLAASLFYYRSVSKPDLYQKRPSSSTFLLLSERLRARFLLLEAWRLHCPTVGAPRIQIIIIRSLAASLFHCRSVLEPTLYHNSPDGLTGLMTELLGADFFQ